MNLFSLILKEIVHRKLNFILSLLAVATAVALFVSFVTTGSASQRETVRLMRDMGLNLRVIPKGTDMNLFFERGFSDKTMPEDYAWKLATHKAISSNHITAVLINKIEWRSKSAILMGITPEIFPPGKEKAPIVEPVEEGTLYVGYRLVQDLDLKRGEEVELEGRPFTIAGCGPESGTGEDITVQCHIKDAQEILDLPGRINEIKAIDCLCKDSEQETLTRLRAQLTAVLPEAEVIQLGAIARARREQRVMVRDYFLDLILPSVVVVCAVWIGLLALNNVRERRREIGIMRALGYGGGSVAGLFLGKAVLTGLAGAAMGFGAGTDLALRFGPDIFKVTAEAIKPDYALLAWSLTGAPLLAALAAFVPAMMAVVQDPVDSLRQE